MSSFALAALRKFVQPLANRVRLLVSRGVVTLVDDSFKMQALQVELLKDELHDEVEHFQPFGFTAHPLQDAEVLYLSVGGNRSAGVVVCVSDRRHRPTGLAEGDVCLYTENGERVYLNKADDIVHIGAKSAAEFIAMATKTLDRLQDIADTFDAHKHPTGMGPSGVPDSLIGTIASVASTKAKVT